MRYISGLPNNPPTHLVDPFHNKPMVDSVKKQLNFIIGTLLNSLQSKAASLDPVRIYMDQMENEKFNGNITFDFLSKGIDYASYYVATKDLLNIRQGWSKISDDFSIGMSAAFVLNNESIKNQLPPAIINLVIGSATAFTVELNAALNYTQNGSMNMQQQFYYPNQMAAQPQFGQGVQAFMQQPMTAVNGQMPYQQQMQMYPQQQMNQQLQQQQIMMILQQNPQLAAMYQQNPQAAMQMIMQQMQGGMVNPYMQRASTVSPMMQGGMQQAPVSGFINNGNSFGQVSESQVGNARGSSFSRAAANANPQQVQLPNSQNNQAANQGFQNGVQPQFNAVAQQPQFTPQPTAQTQQVTGGTVHHGGGTKPVNVTMSTQPISNPGTLPNIGGGYSNLAATDTAPASEPVKATKPANGELVIATSDLQYNIDGRRIPKIYNSNHQALYVQVEDGVAVSEFIKESKVKYEEHETQRILPIRTEVEKRVPTDSTKINTVLEQVNNSITYGSVLEKIRKDAETAGEELVDVEVSKIIAELGTSAITIDVPYFAFTKQSAVPILDTILDKQKIPVDLRTRAVKTDLIIGAPMGITQSLIDAITTLNNTPNLGDYLRQLTAISNLDIPNYYWAWVHDEVLREINKFIKYHYGLDINIDSVLLDLDDLIEHIGNTYGTELSSQVYFALHHMLTSTVLQLFRREEWPSIVDEGQTILGKVHQIITIPMTSAQVPYNSPAKSGVLDRNSHNQLVKVLENALKEHDNYHSVLLATMDGDIIEVSTTTIDGNFIMYCGND